MTVDLLITLLVGIAAGFLLYKLKVPAGMLVGAIIGVSILSVFTAHAVMPANAKLCAQIITGAYIGNMITRDDIKQMPRLIKPYMVIMVTFFALNMLMGFIIYTISPMDLLTSMLCAMPGGISDTPLIAMDMGADAAKVALMQFVRMVFGMGALPSIIVLIDKICDKNSIESERGKQAACVKKKKSYDTTGFVLTLLVAAVAGVIGKKSGIPAGTLVVAMLAVLVFKLFYQKACLPTWCRRAAQILSGCVIGCRMKYEDVLELRYLLLPAVLLLVGYVVNCIVVGMLLHKKFGFSRRMAMLSVSPAGATEMALISADLGVDSPDLIVLQIGRFIGVMTIFPQLIALIS